MYSKILIDPDLQEFFRKTDLEYLKEKHRQFFTYMSGGSSEWKGKSFKEAHEGRGIKVENFDRFALHIVTTLQEL